MATGWLTQQRRSTIVVASVVVVLLTSLLHDFDIESDGGPLVDVAAGGQEIREGRLAAVGQSDQHQLEVAREK